MTDPLALEIGELGTLVKQLAETVAAQQTAHAPCAAGAPSGTLRPPAGRLGAEAAWRNSSPPRMVGAGRPETRSPSRRRRGANAEPAPPPHGRARHERAGRRAGIDPHRTSTPIAIDLYLQPIVTLPQRKVRYYEAMSRLRDERGDAAARGAISFPQAESGGLMPKSTIS